MAGTLIAILKQRGVLSSDRTVDSYLPRLKTADWMNVRLRDVIDMTAGFGDDGSPLDPASLLRAARGSMSPRRATQLSPDLE
jgi:CubicO group peptidase (beta-lactamase class C family)